MAIGPSPTKIRPLKIVDTRRSYAGIASRLKKKLT